MRVSYFGDTDLKPSIIGIPIEPPRAVAKIPLIRATIAALNLVSLISRNTTCRYGTVYIYMYIKYIYYMHIHFTCIRDCMISFNISDILYIYIYLYSLPLWSALFVLVVQAKETQTSCCSGTEFSTLYCTSIPWDYGGLFV